MKCVICNTEFESKRTDAKTCSPKCRVALSRKTAEKEEIKNVAISAEDKKEDITKMSREDIETNIRLYEHDTWKDSPEFAELMRRLNTLSEEELIEGGYSIPASIYRKFHPLKK